MTDPRLHALSPLDGRYAGKCPDLAALFSEAAQKQLAAGHAKGKFITKENAVKGAGIPFHPGAEKFYKEAGLLK